MMNTNSLRSMKSLQASLECLKGKNNVSFTLPQIAQAKFEDINNLGGDRNAENNSQDQIEII